MTHFNYGAKTSGDPFATHPDTTHSILNQYTARKRHGLIRWLFKHHHWDALSHDRPCRHIHPSFAASIEAGQPYYLCEKSELQAQVQYVLLNELGEDWGQKKSFGTLLKMVMKRLERATEPCPQPCHAEEPSYALVE